MPTKGNKKKPATVNLTSADMQILLKRLGYSDQKDFLDDLAMGSLTPAKDSGAAPVEIIETEVSKGIDASKRLSWAEEVEAVEANVGSGTDGVLEGKQLSGDAVEKSPSIAEVKTLESVPVIPVGIEGNVKVTSTVNPNSSNSTKSWSEVVQGNRSVGCGLSLEFIPPTNVVKISEEDWEDGAKLWRFPVVCIVKNVKPSYADMIKWTEVNWKTMLPKVTQLQAGVFICDFAEEEHRLSVIQRNWTYYHKFPMVIKLWSPDKKEDYSTMDTTNVWVQLPNLYPRLWSSRNLSNVVSFIGNPITTDKMTAQRTRMDFARVLVEVKIGEKLPDAIPIEGPNDTTIMQPVVYEWRTKKCMKCGRLGHEMEQCRQRNAGKTGEKLQEVEQHQEEQPQVVEVPVDTVTVQIPGGKGKAVEQRGMKEPSPKKPITPGISGTLNVAKKPGVAAKSGVVIKTVGPAAKDGTRRGNSRDPPNG